jgi:hypothetical protein
MKNNVYKKYQQLKLVHEILSVPLSFSFMFAMYLLITIFGYSEYGIGIAGRGWNKEPTFWDHFRAFFVHGIGIEGILLLVFGALADAIFWPYFYKLKTANIENDIEPAKTSQARIAPRASKMDSERTSEV